MRLTTSKIINDVAKVQIKSEKITPFGGIFHVRELFSRFVAPIIDKVIMGSVLLMENNEKELE